MRVTNVCVQSLAVIKIRIWCFLKKLLFSYTLLLPRLFPISLWRTNYSFIEKTHVCHRSLPYTSCITSLTTKLKVKWLTTKAESKTHTYILRKTTTDDFPNISPEPLGMCFACLCCEPPENSPQIWNAVQREMQSPMNGPAGTVV